MKLNLGLLTVLSTLALSATACSPRNDVAIKGVDLSTHVVNSDTFVDMEAIITMGNLKFPNTEIGIVDPKTQKPLGQLTLQSLADGTNSITISVDYESATRLDSSLGKTLPNERELPSQLLLGSTTVIGIPILQQSRIYVGGDLQKDFYIGAAIAIPALDSTLTQVPIPLNIFFNFPFSPEVVGVGGIFTGTQKGQNGVGIFVKKSAPVPAPAPTSAPAFRSLASVQKASASSTTVASAALSGARSGGEELHKLDTFTMIRLDRLLNRHATLKVK